jgi:hypothetical protein
MRNRRLGRFTVSDTVLRDSITTGAAAHLFAGAVPLDVQRDWMNQTTTYLCWHPEFREVPNGEITPVYVAIFRKGEDGTVTHEWKEERGHA